MLSLELSASVNSEFADVFFRDISGQFILVCEHASSFIPDEYSDLGLEKELLESHIAFDRGALALAKFMAGKLGAPLVYQRASRLLYDCNRPPESESAVPIKSEFHSVPGNTSLSSADRKARVNRFYEPFRQLLADSLDLYYRHGMDPVIVTVHSFTPNYFGQSREVEIGILHDIDKRLADAVLTSMERTESLVVRRNEPYGPADGVTHTLKEHGVPRNLLNVMLEVRNDLLENETGIREIGKFLCRHLKIGMHHLQSQLNSDCRF